MSGQRAAALVAVCLVLALRAGSASACTAHHFGPGGVLEQQVKRRNLLQTEGKEEASSSEEFNYIYGGADWGGLCAEGTRQSPIAFRTAAVKAVLPPAARANLDAGTAKGLRIFNTGHALQVEWDELVDNKATMPVLGGEWGALQLADPAELAAPDAPLAQVPMKPLQLHWHTMASHVRNGEVIPLECHVVMQVDTSSDDPNIPESCKTEQCTAVFAVMIKLNEDAYQNSTGVYSTLLESVPEKIGAEYATHYPDVTLEFSEFLPADQSYMTYSGSLTTPPCTENVAWHVFMEPERQLSAQEMEVFGIKLAKAEAPLTATCGGEAVECTAPVGTRTNNRIIQPINGRTLFLSRQEEGRKSGTS